MSKPQYLRHTAKSPAGIVVAAEELIKYLFTITNNDKQFPKAYRYSLVTDIRNTCLKLNKHIYRAMAIHPRTQEQYERRRREQLKIYDRIIDLKSLMVIANATVNVKNKENVARLLYDIVEMYNRWVKNDRRLFKNLPTEREYYNRRKEQQSAKRVMNPPDSQTEVCAHSQYDCDTDGFIVLKRKVQPNY